MLSQGLTVARLEWLCRCVYVSVRLVEAVTRAHTHTLPTDANGGTERHTLRRDTQTRGGATERESRESGRELHAEPSQIPHNENE